MRAKTSNVEKPKPVKPLELKGLDGDGERWNFRRMGFTTFSTEEVKRGKANLSRSWIEIGHAVTAKKGAYLLYDSTLDGLFEYRKSLQSCRILPCQFRTARS